MAGAMYIANDYLHTVTCAWCCLKLPDDSTVLGNMDLAEGLCWRGCILLSTPCCCVLTVAGSPCLCYWLGTCICEDCKERCAAMRPRVCDDRETDVDSVQPPASQEMD